MVEGQRIQTFSRKKEQEELAGSAKDDCSASLMAEKSKDKKKKNLSYRSLSCQDASGSLVVVCETLLSMMMMASMDFKRV